MVLVTNEWQNKSEDEQKTTANTATQGAGATTTTANTAATTVVTASLSIPAANYIKSISTAASGTANKSDTIAVVDSTNTSSIIQQTISSTTETINTLANDNANNEQNKINDNNSAEIVVYSNNNKINEEITEVEKNPATAASIAAVQNNKLKEEDFDDEGEKLSVLNYNSIKIMAENTKESPLKEEEEEEDENIKESHEIIDNLTVENNKDLIDESNSYTNSNTNTLQAPTSLKSSTQNNDDDKIIMQQQQQVPLSCPITPQALSSALQSALNATNNANNSVQAAAGLQPNFLSQLALTANVAGLQKNTAKQFNQTFNIGLDETTQQQANNKNDSNILECSTATITVGGQSTAAYDNNGQSKIILICEGNSHPFQARTICLTPNVECMVGRLIAKSKASENNAIFDCKVLSRKHAVIWYTPDGKFWVKDTKSSNGTFINDNKLGDEEAELHFGDIVKFGVDVLENSRKEVHGCIIACVKLYLPDGREAISIDSSAAHRSQYSGEGRISYDELHRLNLYIQETSQREKVLTSKLCNIQNILDATRKNSALCWQSMITEDQLLHRIHSLEKKLQFMEKNVPENVLRNEVNKLIDDKSSYQHTAKETLRKVYQERCDAMQMLAKMESAYTQSDNECALLRDQIMNSKQTLQDVNSRLLRLETEYNEYKDDTARQQQEAKEREEQNICELTEKLRERELDCEELKKKISELLIKRADLLDDEEQLLQNQAIANFDAALADMDLGEDDDDDDDDEHDDADEDSDDEDGEEDDEVIKKSENKRNGNDEGADVKDDVSLLLDSKKQKKSKPHIASIFGDNLNGLETNDKSKDPPPKLSKLKKSKAFDSMKQKSPPKRVKESTIMKWLQNSDLNKNEASFDIFKAICNENDDENSSGEDVKDSNKPIKTESESLVANEFTQKCTNFTSKLKNVQKNLKQLEAEIQSETEKEIETAESVLTQLDDVINSANNDGDDDDEDDDDKEVAKHKMNNDDDVDSSSSSDEDNDDEGATADGDFIIKRNGKSSSSSSLENKVLSKENKKYQLLKSSVNMLREAYNEIWDSVREQEESRQKQQQLQQQQQKEEKDKSPPPNIKVKTQLQLHAATTPSPTKSHKKLENQITLHNFDNDITESDSEVESLTLSSPVNNTHRTVIDVKLENRDHHQQLQEQLQEYQSQVGALNTKLQQTELEAHQTLEIMQVECDDVKQKMDSLNKVIEALKDDKLALEKVINENKTNTIKLENEIKLTSEEATKTKSLKDVEAEQQQLLEKELEEDNVLNAINVTALEREEELITYKERLDEQQRQNIELRNEIATLKLKANIVGSTKDVLLKQWIPYGIVVVAILVYFLSTYF